MREQEKQFFEQKKQEKASNHNITDKDMEEFQTKIAPVMAEASAVLKAATNEKISDKGLEALARWKLGL